ncbi:DUF4276 family protein [Variovorax sp. J22R133]|uniref:DUF4276 family protein n=1 Tax=Variovorax brevis TaxID=3053503 RepID=UPI002577FAFD|nr:DUF4276 family protein [Variovorax sp. J22R133]MDM0114866.1 DUF4276 family protein [Variovorax sp. J22R133]
MITVASIVEGDGEVAALPVLLRRLQAWRTPEVAVDVLSPIRVRRDQFLNRETEFSRHLQLAAAKCGDDGWILILMDADDDCPAERGAEVVARARNVVPHRRVGVVFANREYEAWFIAAAQSLDGFRGFACRPEDHLVDAEVPRNAKGWINERIQSGAYGETTDQPAFSQRFDMDIACARSRSFRKLCDEWSRNSVVSKAE